MNSTPYFIGRQNISLLLLAAFTWIVNVSAADNLPDYTRVKSPNIIVILSDDMGWSDIGCMGGEIKTPNLDGLARNGLRFTQFYNTARCCPTRASLLTGLYPHQAGVGHMMEDRDNDGYKGDLNNNCLTIAEVLRPAGYKNYAVGKWHVTRYNKPEGPKHNWPLQRGFDRYYGTIHGAGSYFDPSTLTRDNTSLSPFADPEYKPAKYYYTDAIADHAVRFIQEHKQSAPDKPFFLYTAFTAAHWPMHALPEDIAKYQGKFDGGYSVSRQAHLTNLKQLGLLPSDWTVTPQVGDWSKVTDKAWEARCMEVYAAMVDRMDQGIGRIISELNRQKMLENTLIFYLQDNGGCAENTGRSGSQLHPDQLRSDKPTLDPLPLDALLPAGSTPPQTRDGYPVRMGRKVMPGPEDTYVAYGEAWANVSNTPFREYKHWVHEGGIATPLIVHWPTGISDNQRGKFVSQPGHLIDIMATCIDVAGARYPTTKNEHNVKPPEGVSLVPAFVANPLKRVRPLFWEHEGNRAVRDGKWKLVAKENKPWELYDMEKDRTEMNDLSSTFPDKVSELTRQWNDYAARCNVLPLGGWRGGAAKVDASGNLNTNRVFKLKSGDRLLRSKAPAIAGRPFTVEAAFNAADQKQGVIVAHGGSSLGYTLYLEDGKLVFVVRSAKRVYRVASPEVITGSHTVKARLGVGAMELIIDGSAVAKASAQLINSMPVDGLEIGADEGGSVGSYLSPNQFKGSIESVIISIDNPVSR